MYRNYNKEKMRQLLLLVVLFIKELFAQQVNVTNYSCDPANSAGIKIVL